LKELRSELQRGTFGQMVTIRTKDGTLPFGSSLVQVILDDPKTSRSDGADVFTSSKDALRAAARHTGIRVTIEKRLCASQCKCIWWYQSKSAREDHF
jgi:hypothetical protein